MSVTFLSGLCNCQVKKVIACLYMALIKKGRQKYIFHHTQKTGKILNKTIRQLLPISYFCHTILKKERLAYKSKYNFKRENQLIVLTITDCKK